MVERCRLFSDFSPIEKGTLSGVLIPVSFSKGEILFDEFQEADSVYFIMEGSVGLYRSDNFGRWTKVALIYKGTPLGECAFFLNAPHSLRAVAESPVKALKITKEGAESLKREAPKVYAKLVEKLVSVMAERLKSSDFKFSQICGFFSVPGGGRWKR
ncbi:hypothetical protein C7457_0437 [Thermovibrio guaymasensis]|uniref:Cyclic nucleotide-binding domain-containing protein n=1 Tax=Thermovibrio guaymasensis TaxID=240167 RepID=A0A420W8B9_9BACT|nr:cyclic nucleotide-binding domain-containing protein [Thermovibrio guaymasensis]RKQ63563.1 hypothetical protein C7457_0437 [Thermovibrio guaymasensis]